MPSQPNVLWIVADQLRAQSLGCSGDPNVNTPHINQLATMGVTFSRMYSTAPICSPARAVLLSGRYPHENGLLINGMRMNPELPTVATALRDHGYNTAWFGKWHVDAPHHGATASTPKAGLEYCVPRQRRGGFDTWLGYENLMNPFDGWIHGHRDDGAEVAPYRMDKFDTDALTDLLLNHLEHRAELRNAPPQPFFAAVSYFAPHDPYACPAEWMARHRPGDMRLRANVPDIPRIREQAQIDQAGYSAMIEQLDFSIGRILGKLEQLGLLRNTHVLIFSDHGDMLHSHGLQRKSMPYEEALRVPLIMGGEVARHSNWDGRGWGNCDVPISLLDIAPTTLGLCDIEKPTWMSGRDYSGYRVTGRPKPDAQNVYTGMWVPMGWDGLDWPWRCIVTPDGWKFAAVENQPLMMFNLNEDPHEQANLVYSPAFKAKRKELLNQLLQCAAQAGDTFKVERS